MASPIDVLLPNIEPIPKRFLYPTALPGSVGGVEKLWPSLAFISLQTSRSIPFKNIIKSVQRELPKHVRPSSWTLFRPFIRHNVPSLAPSGGDVKRILPPAG